MAHGRGLNAARGRATPAFTGAAAVHRSQHPGGQSTRRFVLRDPGIIPRRLEVEVGAGVDVVEPTVAHGGGRGSALLEFERSGSKQSGA